MPQIRLILDDDMDKALSDYAERHRLSKRSAATILLTDALAADGAKLDYTPPTRGGWRGSEASIEALVQYADRLTDKGRNDPAESEHVELVDKKD